MVSKTFLTPSAVSTRIATTGAKTPTEALPNEIMHNLQYQHNWTDIRLFTIDPTSTPSLIDCTDSISNLASLHERVYLISGLPPRHSYIHPDFLAHLVKHNMEDSQVPRQREWVLGMSTGETWSLRRFCHVFDHLPVRDAYEGVNGYRHQDVKRILCAMKANDGVGGDGTIVYYIMQEGEVKPRQN